MMKIFLLLWITICLCSCNPSMGGQTMTNSLSLNIDGLEEILQTAASNYFNYSSDKHYFILSAKEVNERIQMRLSILDESEIVEVAGEEYDKLLGISQVGDHTAILYSEDSIASLYDKIDLIHVPSVFYSKTRNLATDSLPIPYPPVSVEPEVYLYEITDGKAKLIDKGLLSIFF